MYEAINYTVTFPIRCSKRQVLLFNARVPNARTTKNVLKKINIDHENLKSGTSRIKPYINYHHRRRYLFYR